MDKKIWRCIRKNFLAVAMVAIFVFSGVQGCRVEAAAKPKFNKKSVMLYVAQSKKLKVNHTKAKVKWSSSNKKIAKVSKKGTVKAVKPGKCTIYAKVKGKKLKCKVEVVSKQQYYGRNLYMLVRQKGAKGSSDVRRISMKIKEYDVENYRTVIISAYPKKWQMQFAFKEDLEEPYELTRVDIKLDVSKDKAGQLKYVYEDRYSDIITRIQGKVEKKCDENKKGLDLTYYEIIREEEDPDKGVPGEWAWPKTSENVKNAFSYYDDLLKKYGYSMKKIGFMNRL